MSKDDNWVILGRIPRDASNEWVIQRGEYWKIDVIDIRLHSNGKPTKKGVRLNVDEIHTLKNILEKVRRNENSRSEEDIEREW